MNMQNKQKVRDKRYKSFNNDWFRRNQPFLLKLLNNKYVASTFREVFGVNHIPPDVLIVSIMPNHVKAYLGGNEYLASFAHYDHFAYVIYSRLKYIWRTIHAWDMHIANKLFPSLNLGYDDLEEEFELVSKGVASHGSDQGSFDYGIRTWAQIRDGNGENAGLGAHLFAGIECPVNEDLSNKPPINYMVNRRSVISYNTSYLGANIKVNSVGVRPYFISQTPTPIPLYGSPYLALVAHNKVTSYVQQNNDVTTSDYAISNFGSDVFASLSWAAYMNMSGGQYYTFNLNQLGLNYVRTKRFSHCAFGFLISCDLLDEEPSSFVSYAKSSYLFDFDEGTSLDITYTAQPQRIVMIQ